jgi:hypothetical protein
MTLTEEEKGIVEYPRAHKKSESDESMLSMKAAQLEVTLWLV